MKILVISLVVLVLVAVPFIFALLLPFPVFSFAMGGTESWINFWGSYLGALISALMVYIVMNLQMNRQEKIQIKAIKEEHEKYEIKVNFTFK